MPLRPKKHIAALRACPHGGLDFAELAELGIAPEAVLDFSVSTNPFMPPPGLRERLRDVPIERYPDSRAGALKQRLAAKLGIDTENILVGSGSTELIRLVALAYFRPGDAVLIPGPTYGEYELAARIAGARPAKCHATEEDGFAVKIGELVETIHRRRPRAVFICNPNNPTGKYLPRAYIETVIKTLGDTLLVLDEAYAAFVARRWPSLDLTGRGNVIILRSLTKNYGLPGLRLGYAVARREIIDVLRLVAPPWNVNAVAQEAGTAALDQDEYLGESLRRTREAKRFLAASLRRLGFKVMPSDAHYFLVKVGNAAACRRALLKYGMLVRDGSSFGLPQYIRVSPRTPPECKKFIEAVKKILDSSEGDLNNLSPLPPSLGKGRGRDVKRGGSAPSL